MKLKTILFATDLSRFGNAALSAAAAIARHEVAKLIILHVEESSALYASGELSCGTLEPDQGAIRKMLEDVKPADSQMTVEHLMVSGRPADAIVRAATEKKANLIVMSTHGRTGLAHFLMGSVAEEVVRKALCPVLVVKPRSKKTRHVVKAAEKLHVPTILVPIDFSPATTAVTVLATSIASEVGAKLVIAHVEQALVPYGEVYSPEILDANTEGLKLALENIRPTDPKIECTHRMINGDPTAEIVRLAEEEKADMIVMGTHGRKGLSHFLMGSVAEGVVRRAKCSVLTLRNIGESEKTQAEIQEEVCESGAKA